MNRKTSMDNVYMVMDGYERTIIGDVPNVMFLEGSVVAARYSLIMIELKSIRDNIEDKIKKNDSPELIAGLQYTLDLFDKAKNEIDDAIEKNNRR